MPKNIRFIISATHSLSGAKESLVELSSLKRLSRKDFLTKKLTSSLNFAILDCPKK
jgi:hypothetical protein